MVQVEKHQKIRVSKEVLFQEVNGEAVLLDLNSESYFGLDEIGTRIWAMLNDGVEVSAMVDLLLEEYEVERETLEKDVEELLGGLLEAGLIKD